MREPPPSAVLAACGGDVDRLDRRRTSPSAKVATVEVDAAGEVRVHAVDIPSTAVRR